MGISSLSGEGTDYINASYIMVSQIVWSAAKYSILLDIFLELTYLHVSGTVFILKGFSAFSFIFHTCHSSMVDAVLELFLSPLKHITV